MPPITSLLDLKMDSKNKNLAKVMKKHFKKNQGEGGGPPTSTLL